MKLLAELIRDALGLELSLPEASVRGVAQDSRLVREGFVFVARPGGRDDGHRFIPQALAAGAVAVVGELAEEVRQVQPWRGAVPYIQVPDARAAVAKLAASFYGHPSRALAVIGVTGTDGKTTTSYLLHHLLSARHPTGLLSTAGVKVVDNPLPLHGHFTTPEAPEVQALLAQMVAAGCTHAVLESSSHGLAQRRLDEVAYACGVWTNLSPEHLDFHGTFTAYRDAKAELVRRAKLSVLNADDEAFPFFASQARELVRYGAAEGVEYRLLTVREEPGRLVWALEVAGKRYEAELPMVGRYNVHNALAAVAAAHRAGVGLEPLLERLASFPGVPGRMQVIQQKPFAVVVDFAHTPVALEKALLAMRPQVEGRLVVVIGSAGERDPNKRTPLGAVAARNAELAIFTEEDHRSESLTMILQQMAEGARAAGGVEGEDFLLVPDRREAIRQAVALARPGDLVLLAGKGHEATLEREDEIIAWDEAEEARRALAALGGARGQG
jgi:UDP-N-acetylmuramoyl-L-alanyl-D-glutamate--2,6-diaminopimelate ligase